MFEGKQYHFKKKVWAWLGSEFEIYNESSGLVLFAKQKAFKLKEDIRLFSSKEMTDEFIKIQARRVIDISAIYDVYDSKSEKKIGSLQRKGLKSIFKDEWLILDDHDNEIGKVQEDSTALAVVRRMFLNLIPQNFDVTIGDKKVMDIKQRFNPFVYKLDLVFEDEGFDKRIGFALVVLLGAIEGRQE